MMATVTKRKKPKPAPEPAATPTIIDLCRDPDFFADWFKDEKSWRTWFAFLRVLFALPLDAEDLKIFQECTGQSAPNPSGYFEVSLLCGRRSGKSLILALIATYLACFKDYRQHLVKNERATIMVLASDKKQAQSIFRYLKGFLSVPLLAGLIERETAEVLELTNGVSLEVTTASFKTLRGRTVAAALADESCFWNTDDGSANPDTEIFAALSPAMATIPGAMMFKASSPYAKRGSMYDDFKRYYGREGSPVLVWKAATWTMNPSVPQSFIDAAYERDPASAAAELGSEWRTDVSGWLDLATIEAAVDNDVTVRPPAPFITYTGFADMSGGVKDSAAVAIAHMEAGIAVLDCVVEIPAPHSPAEAAAQVASVLRSYNLSEVTADRYGSGFSIDAFAKHGIKHRASERDASTIFVDVLPLFSSGRVRLISNQRLVNQLAALERKTNPSGRDRVGHPPGGHDDIAVAAAGALVLATTQSKRTTLFFGSVETARSLPAYYGF
jgi:hypothetical protein